MPANKEDHQVLAQANFPISRLEALRGGIGPSEIAVLVAVAELKSISKAAALFGLTTASLSQRLKAIELTLGQTVFRRFSRGVELNSAGQAIYPKILDAAYSFSDTADSISSLMESKLPAPIVISCPKIFGELYLAPLIIEYVKENPGVQIHLNIDNSSSSIDEQRFEILFRAHRLFAGEPIPPYDFTARRVMRRPMTLCSSADYASKNAHLLDGVADAKLIEAVDLKFRIASAWQLAWSDWRLQDIQTGNIEAFRVKVNQSTNSARILKKYLLAGLGVGIIPSDLVRDEVADGRLVCPIATHRAPDLVVHMIHHRKAVRKEARSVMAFLADRLEAEEAALNTMDT